MLLQAPIPAAAIRDTISRIVLERGYQRSVTSTLLARGWDWFSDLLGKLFRQAAGSRGTYLISITVLPIALAYLFLFAAYFRAQAQQAPAGTIAPPGGARTARIVAATGFVVTLVTVVCTVVPSPNEPHKTLAVAKLVIGALILIASGVGVYFLGRRRAEAVRARAA